MGRTNRDDGQLEVIFLTESEVASVTKTKKCKHSCKLIVIYVKAR